MHEGEHAILDSEHDHAHQPAAGPSPAAVSRPPGRASRLIAFGVVAAGVALFLVWRFL